MLFVIPRFHYVPFTPFSVAPLLVDGIPSPRAWLELNRHSTY